MITSVGGMFLGFKSLKVASKNIIKLEDSNTVLVIWNGDAEIVTGASYKNSYVNLFKLKDGKIYEIVEYYNPLVILETFLGQKF
jgi:ketosteroid isomerase-like protein